MDKDACCSGFSLVFQGFPLRDLYMWTLLINYTPLVVCVCVWTVTKRIKRVVKYPAAVVVRGTNGLAPNLHYLVVHRRSFFPKMNLSKIFVHLAGLGYSETLETRRILIDVNPLSYIQKHR